MRRLSLADVRAKLDEVEPATALRAVPLDDEAAARAAIESARGESYTDAQWSEAKRNLTEFFGVLAEWNR